MIERVFNEAGESFEVVDNVRPKYYDCLMFTPILIENKSKINNDHILNNLVKNILVIIIK